MNETNVVGLLELGLRTIEVLIVPIGWWIGRMISDIRDKLVSIQVAIASFEEWKRGHSDLDEERHRGIDLRFKQFEHKLWGNGEPKHTR